MSNEEAILVLQNDAYVLYEDDSPYDRQAYAMAIKALKEKEIKTNADRIRNMSDEELATILWSFDTMYGKTREEHLEWLKQEENK